MNIKTWILILSFFLLLLSGCKINCPCVVKNVDFVSYEPGLSVEKTNYYELTIVDSNRIEKIIKSYSYRDIGDTIR